MAGGTQVCPRGTQRRVSHLLLLHPWGASLLPLRCQLAAVPGITSGVGAPGGAEGALPTRAGPS